MRILQNQGPADSFIYWMEDNYVPQALNKRETAVKRCGFTDEPSEGAVAWAQNGELVINSPVPFSMPLSQLSLPGKHNLRNSIAAALATLAAGSTPKWCVRDFLTFPAWSTDLKRLVQSMAFILSTTLRRQTSMPATAPLKA